MSEAPNVVPAGSFYEAEIPDTLDLAARAELALQGMLNTLDPALMTMYGLAHFSSPTPFLQHWSADIPLDPKLAESLPLMRLMCGTDFKAPLEQAYRAELLSRIDDGLYWDRFTPSRPWRNVYNNSMELYGEGRPEDFASVWGVARMARALAAWAGVNGSDTAATRASLIRGLRRIAVDRGDYSYYPHKGGWHDGFVYPRSGWINTEEATRDREGPEGSVTCFQGHQIYAAAQLYADTGDPVAQDLAARLSRYVMKEKFWGGSPVVDAAQPGGFRVVDDVAFRHGAQYGHWPVHFHARAIALRGVLKFAMTCGDDRALAFVRSAYEFTMSQGIRSLGWINTHPPGLGCEGCALGDLIGMAIRMTEAGLGDYWDDVDAIVRNQLAEQQITDAPALAAFCAAQPAENRPAPLYANYETTEDAVQRSVGIFFGVARADSVGRPWVMQCCTGNATQGLYYAWEGALRETPGAAVVNLLLNRSGRSVDVASHLPHAGRVDVRVRQPGRVSLRIPHWVDLGAVELRARGSVVPAERLGRYLTVRDLRAGDLLTVTFPIRERTETWTVNQGGTVEETYDCVFRGSTAVSVRGRGGLQPYEFPLYQHRSPLRTPVAPLKRTHHFVSDCRFANW